MEELYQKLIALICSGSGTSYANKDIVEFKPGTIQDINDTLVRISERKKIYKEYNLQ